MKHRAFICLLLACSILGPVPCVALNLGKTPAHYAQELEYYYLRPRPEMLPPMLESFDRSGQLADGEKRMFIASFLAALAQEGKVKLPEFRSCKLGPQGELTIAWAAYLNGDDALATQMLRAWPDWVGTQMRKRPARLEQWDPTWEKSVLGMFWAAFLATGSDRWLDTIIDGALKHAHHNKGGSLVAASLYDYAPRHEAIIQRVKTRLPQLKEDEAQILETILAHSEGKY